jgi:hypothetical protein
MTPFLPSHTVTGQPGKSSTEAKAQIFRRPEFRLPALAVLLVLAVLMVVSWQRWTSPIIDSGREMDLPLRLLQGEVLYRDVHYIYPPLSPYLNALLYHLFGIHLSVLHFSGFVCTLAILLICWRVASRFLSAMECALALTAVTLWCLLRPEGNLIMPYSFAALHGLLLSLASLLLTLRISERRRIIELVLNGMLIGLCAITKQEFAVTAAITATAGLLYIHRRSLRPFLRDLLLTAIPAILVSAPVYIFLLRHFGWEMMVKDCHLFLTHLPASLIYYNRQRTGLNHPFVSLLHIAGAAAVGIAFASLITLLSTIGLRNFSNDHAPERNLRVAARNFLRKTLLSFAGSLLLAFAVYFLTRNISSWDGSPLRALPLMLLVILFSSWRYGIQGSSSPAFARNRILFILAAYALTVLFRVALRVPSGGAFGGFFLPVSLMLIVYVTGHALPRLIEDLTQFQRLAARVRRIGLSALTMMMLVTLVIFSVRYQRNFTLKISTQRGTLYAPAGVGQAVHEAIQFIELNAPPDAAIGIFPEGSDLAFLSGRRMPMRHQILLPGFLSEQDEREAIATLERENVRYLFLVNRRVIEFGKTSFGNDHYLLLGRWIKERFRSVRVCSYAPDQNLQPGDPEFFIRIYERTSLSSVPGLWR